MRIIEVLEGNTPPVWYSGLTRAVAQIPQNTAPARQWAGVIQNLTQRGVKQAEIDYSGVIAWLTQQPGPVSKFELVRYLRDREVQVNDVIRGPHHDNIVPDEHAGQEHGPAWQNLVQQGQAIQASKPPFVPEDAYQQWLEKSNANTTQMDQLHAQMVNDTMSRMGVNGKKTAYDEYKLPGGRDYREMILTTPPKQHQLKVGEPERKTYRWEGRQPVENVIEYRFQIGDEDGNITYWPETYGFNGKPEGPKWKINSTFLQNGTANSLEHAKQSIEERFNSGDYSYSGRRDVYKHGHWGGIANPLAHIRFDTREDASGEPVLHVAELQSDWHQAGRKHGYRGEPVEINWKPGKNHNRPLIHGYGANGKVVGTVEPITDTAWEAWTDERGVIGQNFKTEEEAKQAVEDYATNGDRYSANKRPPPGPFRKEWPALAVKRILRYAADHGFNRVTWDMGKTQAKRFDLSQSVSQIVYSEQTGTLEAYNKRGKKVVQKEDIRPDQLPDYIGKEATERLLAQPDEPLKGQGWTSNKVMVKRLNGEALKVGESGMTGFYDQILPMLINKMTKKWGGRVYQTKVSAPKGRAKFAPAWAVDLTPEIKQAVQSGQGLWESDSSQD